MSNRISHHRFFDSATKWPKKSNRRDCGKKKTDNDLEMSLSSDSERSPFNRNKHRFGYIFHECAIFENSFILNFETNHMGMPNLHLELSYNSITRFFSPIQIEVSSKLKIFIMD